MNGLSGEQQFILITTASFLSGIMLWVTQRRFPSATFLTSELINPLAVSSIVADLNLSSDEDTAILEAWQWVGAEIDYSSYGSFLTLTQDTITCEKCLLPLETVAAGEGNCVAKSALLASILRTFMSPERVFLAIGRYHRNGTGGHAWVEIERGGTWYIVEATGPPSSPNPWVASALVCLLSEPDAFVNDVYLDCLDPNLCGFSIEINEHPCNCGSVHQLELV